MELEQRRLEAATMICGAISESRHRLLDTLVKLETSLRSSSSRQPSPFISPVPITPMLQNHHNHNNVVICGTNATGSRRDSSTYKNCYTNMKEQSNTAYYNNLVRYTSDDKSLSDFFRGNKMF